MHDTRVGRFFAVDRLSSKYPHYTPYSFSGNKVIAYVELEGMEELLIVSKNANLDDPYITSLDGIDLSKDVVTMMIEKTGNIMVDFSYDLAVKKGVDGNLVASNGKTYKTKRIVSETVESTIDGSVISKKQYGANFGFKKDGKIVTTKGIDQLEALSNVGEAGKWKLVGKFLKNVADLSFLVDLAKAVSNADGMYVDALELSPVGDLSKDMKQEWDTALTNGLDNEFNTAKSKGIEATKKFINQYNQNYTKNFQVLYVSDSALSKVLDGTYKDYVDVFDDTGSSSTEPTNALLIEYTQDKAIIHHIFVDDK